MTDTTDIEDRTEQLESYDGSGTELVTLSVPPDKSLRSVRERILREHAQAEGIRSDRTRERVQRALDRIQRLLRRYGETPDDGLVVYAGVVDGDLVSEVFDDLPTPVAESQYRCDDEFDLTPLFDATSPSETFGLVVVERGGAAIGRLVGEQIVPVRILGSRVMGKSRAGGQSAKRFERERDRQEHEFFETVAGIANDAFLADGHPIDGLVVGGTLATAKRFVRGQYLDHRLRERLLGTYPVEYATRRGLEQLVDEAADQLLSAENREARAALAEFYSRLRDGEPVAYGLEDVERAVEFGAVETALVASSIPTERREMLSTGVSQQGGEQLIVSTEYEPAARFADQFGGVGALLRFPVR